MSRAKMFTRVICEEVTYQRWPDDSAFRGGERVNSLRPKQPLFHEEHVEQPVRVHAYPFPPVPFYIVEFHEDLQKIILVISGESYGF